MWSSSGLLLSALSIGIVTPLCFDNGDKEISGKCYKFVAQRMSFEDARNWCHFKNPVTQSYLAYVPDQTTASFLSTYARSLFNTNNGDFWIGLSRNRSANIPFHWDNGNSLIFSLLTTINEDFAAQSILNSKWNTYQDTTKLPFVCSYDPTAPPTFPTSAPSTPTMAPPNPTTTEEYDEFCNIGEKHSTFLFAYSSGFDGGFFVEMKAVVINAITANRHNYTKLAMVQFDLSSQYAQNITYFDDVQSFSAAIDKNLPNPSQASPSSNPSDMLSVLSSFLSASGRPLESSMVLLMIDRFPAVNADLTADEYDVITNNNVKIFTITSGFTYEMESAVNGIGTTALSKLTANSNGHVVIGFDSTFVSTIEYLMQTAYLDSLVLTRSFVDNFASSRTKIGQLRVPHSETSNLVNFTVTINVLAQAIDSTDPNGIRLTFYENANSLQEVVFEPGSIYHTNFYYATFQLKQNTNYQVFYTSSLDSGSTTMIRVWTEAKLYHYGSYASLEDPMGGNTLSKVDEYQGAALRMKLMNDCYSEHAGYAVFTDCTGTVSRKYDSSQSIPIDYIFADEGSFPHYPIVPFFCDSTPKNTNGCVPGTESKYDIQFVAGEFTVNRSFQCRPGVGQVNPNCKNIDSNGNYYCNRNQLPYMRGPTGQIPDCLGHGHVEYDFANAEAYICVCDNGYSGDSCEKSG